MPDACFSENPPHPAASRPPSPARGEGSNPPFPPRERGRGEGEQHAPGTLSAAIRAVGKSFNAAGLQSPHLDARILAAEACGISAEEAIVCRDNVLSADASQKLMDFAARRLAGEPVSRILGRREFWGLSFKITPATLDPRPETELLVETVLEHFDARGLRNAPLRLLDLGTGSGCLLAALLSELPLSFGIGVDKSEAVLEAARENLSQLGLLDRVAFLFADWMSAIGDAEFDAIVCNPPYIAPSRILELEIGVRAYDPWLALDGGKDGLEAYRLIIPRACNALRKGGALVFETGIGQAQAVQDIMVQHVPDGDNSAVRILTDLAGTERAVAGVRQL
jgi:release factor glutamine methyltransferase